MFSLAELAAHGVAKRPRRVSFLRHTPNYDIAPGETAVIADVDGAGSIHHIWCTTSSRMEHLTRKLVLRIFWDGEPAPSVEVPLGDFFGIGHGVDGYDVRSLHLVCNPTDGRGYNAYFPMPYANGFRIEVANEGEQPLPKFFFQVDYHEYLGDCPTALRFHAVFRRENPCRRTKRKYTILDTAGSGFYLGCVLNIRVLDDFDGWFHGGGDTVYIDGRMDPAVLHGIGGEDFFGAAWGIRGFSNLLTGCPYQEGNRLSMYRFHTDGPLYFRDSIRVDFGAMANDLSSVAYWYQQEPHPVRVRPLAVAARLPEASVERDQVDARPMEEGETPWLVIGPFANRHGEGMNTLYPPEEGLDLAATYSSGPIHNYWRRDFASVAMCWEEQYSVHGFVDFTTFYRPDDKGSILIPGEVLGYAYTEIETEDHCEVAVLLGHDDSVRVFLRGEPVYAHPGGCGMRKEQFALRLRPGRNPLMVKIGNTHNHNWWWWGFALSPVGWPAGVRFALPG